MGSFRAIRTFLFALFISVVPAASFAGVFVSITVAPPALPVYAQPVCPGDGYLWTPGYWAYAPTGYYWVQGVWVRAPQPGLLWTPGYWGFGGGLYAWHAGYWGPHVGFYGGVHYGFGYDGVGFVGGRWEGGHFAYNTAVMHVDRTVVHNTYVDRTVIRNTTVINRTSFNGPGGIDARATREQQSAAREQHFQATSEQTSHERQASFNRSNFASENRGRPDAPAMSRPARGNGFQQENRAAYGGSRPENVQARANFARNQRPVGNDHPRANRGERNGNQGGNHGGGGRDRR